jgi:UDP-N-acetylglucosamine 2-epimerase (non-hydrolysing)
VDDPVQLSRFVGLLNVLAEEHGLRIIVSTHPRTRKRLQEATLAVRPEVEWSAPLGFLDYVQLEMNAMATLSDSGTISEESSILSFPALNLRDSHERPEAMEQGAVMMTGFDCDRVREALQILSDRREEGNENRIPADYGVPDVSRKVLYIIESYVNYVKRVVWAGRS